MNTVLMIAFHFPPFVGSSGIHRTLKFAQYLPEYGWKPIVLTAHPRAYPNSGRRSPDLPGVHVHRAFALDTARHLSLRGFHVRALATPDRWVSWWPGGVLAGRRLIAEHKPSVIWSTFPIATAHLIGASLHRSSNIPWVADFRDPMVERDPQTGIEYPLDPSVRKANARIERLAVNSCARAVFTTPGTVKIYTERYAALPTHRFRHIANGYDEEDFETAEARESGPRPDKVVLVHSGIIYPDARDPRVLFAALGELRQAGAISGSKLKIVLRASGHESLYRAEVAKNGIDDIVFLEPAIPYHDALAEMVAADGLLVLQAPNCNWQIPAKVYECLRAGRPILALTDPAGDTAQLLRSHGIDTILPLLDKGDIKIGVVQFLERLRRGDAPVPERSSVVSHSRRGRTRELASLLDDAAQDIHSAVQGD